VDGDLGALRTALPSYEIGSVLGRGAWGTVVAAHHRALNRAVAIKWLRPELVDDADARGRFNAEAQVLAALDHPHVVRIYDYVEVDDVCALVMERLPGGTIADRTRVGPLPPQSACAYAMAALHGLEHAHHHDVLHRDVKPENLMLAGDGRLRVTDFGIAAIVGGNAQRLTQTGVALGTPAYMAPEQLSDPDRIGTYTDVWSTAAVLYELLARQVPYEARSTVHAALLARATEDPRPVRELVPEVPEKLNDAVMRGLARDIDDRYATCHEAAEAIDSAATDAWGSDWLTITGIPLQRTPPRARAAATGVVPVQRPVVPASTSEVIEPEPVDNRPGERRGRRSRTALWASGVAVLVAGAIVATVTLSGRGSPSGATTTTSTGSGAGSVPGGLPAVPAGWGSGLNAGVAVPDLSGVSRFGRGALFAYNFNGDPASGADFSAVATEVRDIEAAGAVPLLSTYVLRLTGHPHDQSPKQLLKTINDPRLMKPYWLSSIELIKQLGSVGKPLFLTVDLSVAADVQAQTGNDPKAVPAAVASSGVHALAGIPNTFAGWAQAWVQLRNTYAPDVRLGWNVASWGVGDYFIPHRPTVPTLGQYEQNLRDFYRGLGTKFDYVDYTTSYGDGGKSGPSYVAQQRDITILEHWASDMVSATHLRVILDGIPVGNTLMRAENNTPYHWQDRYAQLVLGDTAQARANLLGLRNAGVIGLDFGAGYASPDFTCACDAAGDGVTNPKPKGTARLRSLSADDDGGYLAARLAAYATGRLPV
jgi:serine/threonine-protein kinase